MNKLTAAIMISAALPLGWSAAAQAEEHSGFFIDGRLGRASVDDSGVDDSTFGGTISAGYRWGYWGVDLGYANFNGFGDGGVDLDVDGITAGLNARFNIADHWYVSARGGAFAWDADLKAGNLRISDDGTDFYAGIGAGYDFSQNFSAGLAYDYFNVDAAGDADVDLISLNGELRF
ncbi:MAG: porin family protein [Xanthomonadales bacterium]|nr:porin family protein [Xanthomonadales bacterium]